MSNVVSFTSKGNAASILDRICNEAYELLLEARNYMTYVAPGLRENLSDQDRLQVTYHSTRLTSCLLEMISWLMAQKAVQNGEMSIEDSRDQGFTISNDPLCLREADESIDHLPHSLMSLIERSETLYKRLARLDQMIDGKAA